MKIYLKLLLAGLVVFSIAMGCKKKDDPTQKVAPESEELPAIQRTIVEKTFPVFLAFASQQILTGSQPR